MELIDVQMPSTNIFDLSSYIISYNGISNEDVIYVSFEELFENNPSIESLKLIKFK